eukprot:NODE_750_length_2387_cov_31.651502_g641_i0.p1 GENE.NODE_750_length_2387_cov_31.651502_g641_i0~~NODE_750_length_2387_cov_31.651502_g641_i0.p1  ORF type:complete len:649 (-),score=107.29 NODE_750_length_2387_cov_31.651502_g641_i0:195-2141(-)
MEEKLNQIITNLNQEKESLIVKLEEANKEIELNKVAKEKLQVVQNLATKLKEVIAEQKSILANEVKKNQDLSSELKSLRYDLLNTNKKLESSTSKKLAAQYELKMSLNETKEINEKFWQLTKCFFKLTETVTSSDRGLHPTPFDDIKETLKKLMDFEKSIEEIKLRHKNEIENKARVIKSKGDELDTLHQQLNELRSSSSKEINNLMSQKLELKNKIEDIQKESLIEISQLNEKLKESKIENDFIKTKSSSLESEMNDIKSKLKQYEIQLSEANELLKSKSNLLKRDDGFELIRRYKRPLDILNQTTTYNTKPLPFINEAASLIVSDIPKVPTHKRKEYNTNSQQAKRRRKMTRTIRNEDDAAKLVTEAETITNKDVEELAKETTTTQLDLQGGEFINPPQEDTEIFEEKSLPVYSESMETVKKPEYVYQYNENKYTGEWTIDGFIEGETSIDLKIKCCRKAWVIRNLRLRTIKTMNEFLEDEEEDLDQDEAYQVKNEDLELDACQSDEFRQDIDSDNMHTHKRIRKTLSIILNELKDEEKIIQKNNKWELPQSELSLLESEQIKKSLNPKVQLKNNYPGQCNLYLALLKNYKNDCIKFFEMDDIPEFLQPPEIGSICSKCGGGQCSPWKCIIEEIQKWNKTEDLKNH